MVQNSTKERVVKSFHVISGVWKHSPTKSHYDGSNEFTIAIRSIFLKGCFLQYTSFLSVCGKKSVVVSVVISIHVSGSRGGHQNSAISQKIPWIIGPTTQS